MKNNKAFTLIEILAVVIILSLLLIIAVPSVINIIKKSKERTFENTKSIVEKVARDYYSLNEKSVEINDNVGYIPLSDIAKYTGVVKDPNGKVCDGRVKVSLIKENKYIYEAQLSCGKGYDINEDIIAPVINLNGENTVYLWKGIDTYIETVTAIDNIDGDLTNSIQITIRDTSNASIVSNIDTSKLGEYEIEYRVVDSSFNVAKSIRKVIVREDNESPLVAIINETEGVKSSHSVRVEVTDASPYTKYYQWTLNSNPPASDDLNWHSYIYDSEITGSDSLVYGATGDYYLHIKAVDDKGNTTIVSDDNLLSFDNSDLVVILTPDNTNIAKSHTVNISINKTSIVDKKYKWSNSPDTPTTGWVDLNTDSLTLNGLNGDWYLHVKITDSIGSVITQVSPKITLDNVTPIINFTMDNDEYRNSHTTTVMISDLYFENGKTYYVYNNSIDNPSSTDSSWQIYYGDTITKNNLNGQYYLHIKAIDDASNETIETSPLIYFDSINPTLTLTPSTTTLTNSDVVITATGSDSGGSGFYRIKKPDNTFVSSTSTTYTVSANGTYNFTAYDNAGNSYLKSITISNIDKDAPATPGAPDLAAGSDTGYSSSDNITKNTSVSVSGSSAEANSTYYLYNGSTQIGSGTVSASGTWSISVSLSANTTNGLKVRVKDAAGNYSNYSSVLNIIVDTIDPSISVSKNPNDWTTGSITITPSCSDTNLYTCSPSAYATQSVGTHTFTATDKAGNSNSASTTISNRTEYYYYDKFFNLDGDDYARSTVAGIYGLLVGGGSEPFVFEAGLVFTAFGEDRYIFDTAESDGDPRFALYYHASTGKIALYSKYNGTVYINSDFNFSPSLNTYYVIRLEGGTSADRGYSLYINNTYIGTSGSSYRFADVDQYTYIGKRYSGSNYFVGRIYYFRFKARKADTADVDYWYYGLDLNNPWYTRYNAINDYRFDLYGGAYIGGAGGSWSTSYYDTWLNEGLFRSRSTRTTYK